MKGRGHEPAGGSAEPKLGKRCGGAGRSKCWVLRVEDSGEQGPGTECAGAVVDECQPHGVYHCPTPQCRPKHSQEQDFSVPPKTLGHSALLIPAPVGTNLQEGTRKDFIHRKRLKLEADPVRKRRA